MNMLSSFPHPSVVPNPLVFNLSLSSSNMVNRSSKVLTLRCYANTLASTSRAGPWHRRNRQMLGAPPIHRGARKKAFSFTFFLLPILLQYYTFKMLHNKRLSHKTTILLLSSVRHIFSRTAALPHTSVT